MTSYEECHKLYYGPYDAFSGQDRPDNSVSWLGHSIQKCQFDLMLYQEIIYETRPDTIVELGTASGGSAVYFAGICSLIGNGRVIVTRCSHFQDLRQYEDEVYFVGDDLTSTVTEVLDDVHRGRPRIPKRILDDVCWKRCANLYLNMYEELV